MVQRQASGKSANAVSRVAQSLRRQNAQETLPGNSKGLTNVLEKPQHSKGSAVKEKDEPAWERVPLPFLLSRIRGSSGKAVA